MRQPWRVLFACIGALKINCTGLDVTFAEDASQRTGHAPQNLALLRRIALNSLNRELSFKRSTAEI